MDSANSVGMVARARTLLACMVVGLVNREQSAAVQLMGTAATVGATVGAGLGGGEGGTVGATAGAAARAGMTWHIGHVE